MQEQELQITSSLTDTKPDHISYSDDGFLSRGYVIDNGRIVFKFKKRPDASYKNEIDILNFVNSLNANINLQKVGWKSADDSYLGIFGVIGKSLESINLSDEQCQNYGEQLGSFLKILHSANYAKAEKLSIVAEISAWQDRFQKSKPTLARFFNDKEIAKMDNFVKNVVPQKLLSLDEKMVFSHGDLGMGNIFVDDNNKIGIIDFNESSYLDEAADFMDIENDLLCSNALKSYGANDILLQKVTIRREVRPMFVIGTYQDRTDAEIQRFVKRIQSWLANN